MAAIDLAERPRDLAALADGALVERIKRGDHAAFGAVIQRHNRRLFRVARGVVRNDDEAEDIVQETYVRAFANIAAFRGEAQLSTWLTRIALNEALDRLRRRRPEVELSVVETASRPEELAVPTQLIQPDANPEEAAARSEIRRFVEAAVDGLPPAFRLVFIMREIEAMSVEETAQHLGLKPETVKTRLHRARRLLRDRLEDRLASAVTGAFPFDGARCEKMTERVLKRLRLA